MNDAPNNIADPQNRMAQAVAQNFTPLHLPATPDDDELTALTGPQLQAVQLLAIGKSHATAAASVGVCRRTVFYWNRDPIFKRALDNLRRQLWKQACDRLRSLVHPSLDELEKQLREGSDRSRFRSANAVLRHANIKKAVPVEPSQEQEDDHES